MSENALATAGGACPDTMIDGIQAVYAEWDVLQFGRLPEIMPDTAALHVIAHEFAHVVLRHGQISTTAGNLHKLFPAETYSEEAMENLKLLHEDAANLQAWVWGFREEMAAFYEAFPEAPRPRWYIEAKWEEPV